MRTWVSPVGKFYDVSDENLAAFCRANGRIHHGNMLDHIASASSDQKNNGWRLMERMKCIRLAAKPNFVVPAVGTLDAFHRECLAARDGRANMKDKGTLGKLLAGTYKGGGKPWHGFELCQLSAAEKRAVLARRLAAQTTIGSPVSHASAHSKHSSCSLASSCALFDNTLLVLALSGHASYGLSWDGCGHRAC